MLHSAPAWESHMTCARSSKRAFADCDSYESTAQDSHARSAACMLGAVAHELSRNQCQCTASAALHGRDLYACDLAKCMIGGNNACKVRTHLYRLWPAVLPRAHLRG